MKECVVASEQEKSFQRRTSFSYHMCRNSTFGFRKLLADCLLWRYSSGWKNNCYKFKKGSQALTSFPWTAKFDLRISQVPGSLTWWQADSRSFANCWYLFFYKYISRPFWIPWNYALEIFKFERICCKWTTRWRADSLRSFVNCWYQFIFYLPDHFALEILKEL